MQERYTPREWDDLVISWELDPPVEERLAKLVDLLAQLIADQRNIHRGKDAPIAHAADFLPPEPKDEDDEAETDASEAGERAEEAAEVNALHGAMIRGGVRTGQRFVPRGARPPGAALDAFFKPDTTGTE